jgi:uncharacterized protein with HEPN domain
MPPEREDSASLVDMLGFAREVVTFARGRNRTDLDNDRALLRSLERSLELVGECARRISAATREAHPEVPWQDIVGMRNIIAHEYGRVDLDEIWRTALRDAPKLVVALQGAAVKNFNWRKAISSTRHGMVLAEKFAASSSSAVAAAVNRRLMWSMWGAQDPPDAVSLDLQCVGYLAAGADAQEGIKSFFEKRAPNFLLKPSKDMPPIRSEGGVSERRSIKTGVRPRQHASAANRSQQSARRVDDR